MVSLVVPNDVVCNAGNTLVSNSYTLSNLSPNASIHRVLVAGFALPNTFGSMTPQAPVTVTITCGNTGLQANDAVMSTLLCPTGATGIAVPGLSVGAFAAEAIITLRANNKTASAPNLVISAVGIDPVAVFAPTGAAVGNVNVISTAGSTNNALVGIFVTGGGGTANIVVQHCSVTQLN